MIKINPLEEETLHYSNWTQQFAFLSRIEREDPMQALMDMCKNDTLYKVRMDLWDLLSAAMYSPHNDGHTPEAKGELVFLFKQLFELWEVAYRIKQLVQENKLVYTYKIDEKDRVT
jgi:hypothetical protein